MADETDKPRDSHNEENSDQGKVPDSDPNGGSLGEQNSSGGDEPSGNKLRESRTPEKIKMI
jgi:hypothetical protein